LKRNQCTRICRESPQKAWQEASPIRLPSTFSPYRSCRISPRPKFPILQIICHDPLLHNVCRISRQPKTLCTQSTRPKIDRRCAQVCIVPKPLRENIIRAPPDKEPGPEHHCGAQAMEQSLEAVSAKDFH